MVFRRRREHRGAYHAAVSRAWMLPLTLVAACADPDPAVRGLRLTAPVGTAELVPVPDEALTVAWTAEVDGDPQLALRLVPDAGGPPLELGSVAARPGALVWRLPAPPPTAGSYRVRAVATGDGRVLATADASAIVVMQGVWFAATALAFTGADVDRDVELTAILGQQIDLELTATPVGAATPRHVLARATLASDLAPIRHAIRWRGVDLDGVALPAGGYDVTATVAPRARPGTRYQVAGPVVTWTP